jgi:Flp pilus assembly protein TadG
MTSIRRGLLSPWLRFGRAARALRRDCRGVAAVEFVFIAPLMLVAFFGTVEFCSAVAIDRKMTLIARTLSDLTSQSAGTVTSSDMMTNFYSAGLIVTGYSTTPTKMQVSEVYVDSKGKAKIQWSQAGTLNAAGTPTLATSTRNAGDDVTSIVPASLLVKKTYLVFSEVSYLYVPAVGYVLGKTGINMGDVSYTRPRQSTCITYNNLPAGNCPLT